MSVYAPSTIRSKSGQGGIRDTESVLAAGNETALKQLLRDDAALNPLQRDYLQLCYDAQPPVKPDRKLLKCLADNQLEWNTAAHDRHETLVVAKLLKSEKGLPNLREVWLKGITPAKGPGAVKTTSLPRHMRASSASAAATKANEKKAAAAQLIEKDPLGEAVLIGMLTTHMHRMAALTRVSVDGLRSGFGKDGGGAAKLAKGIKAVTWLKALMIKGVSLSDTKGLQALADTLASQGSIVNLGLVNCGLKEDLGAQAVGVIIKAHLNRRNSATWSAGLRKPYNYASNPIGAPARVALMGLLTLDLSSNRLHDRGLHTVLKALQGDTWLVGLNLSNNGLTNKSAKMLKICLQHQTTLCALVLDDNPEISEDQVAEVEAMLRDRTVPEVVLGEPCVVEVLQSWGFASYRDGKPTNAVRWEHPQQARGPGMRLGGAAPPRPPPGSTVGSTSAGHSLKPGGSKPATKGGASVPLPPPPLQRKGTAYALPPPAPKGQEPRTRPPLKAQTAAARPLPGGRHRPPHKSSGVGLNIDRRRAPDPRASAAARRRHARMVQPKKRSAGVRPHRSKVPPRPPQATGEDITEEILQPGKGPPSRPSGRAPTPPDAVLPRQRHGTSDMGTGAPVSGREPVPQDAASDSAKISKMEEMVRRLAQEVETLEDIIRRQMSPRPVEESMAADVTDGTFNSMEEISVQVAARLKHIFSQGTYVDAAFS